VSRQPDYRIQSEIGTNPTRKAKLRPPSYWDISCQAFEAAGPEQAPIAKEIRVVLWEQVWNVPSTLSLDCWITNFEWSSLFYPLQPCVSITKSSWNGSNRVSDLVGNDDQVNYTHRYYITNIIHSYGITDLTPHPLLKLLGFVFISLLISVRQRLIGNKPQNYCSTSGSAL